MDLQPEHTTVTEATGRPLSPSLKIPTTRIISIEHPCIVQSVENGLKSLGGEPRLRAVLDHHVGDSTHTTSRAPGRKVEPVAGVSLRSSDPFAKKIQSVGLTTHNVLVKVVLPKRTGRKRKRGSEEPFQFLSEEPARFRTTAPQLLRRMRDNDGNFSVEPVGMLQETHRFRGLPDFQLQSNDVPIMHRVRKHLMVPSYNALQDFKVDTTFGSDQEATKFPGPPSFTNTEQPFKYEYQPSTARDIREMAKKAAALEAEQSKDGDEAERGSRGLEPDVAEIPSQPLLYVKMRGINEEFVKQAEVKLKKLLEERPVITRRYIEFYVPGSYSDVNFKEAIHRVTYAFRAGPFMNCLIKYGLDPRRDPKYRFYQTFQFQDQRPDKTRKTIPISEGEENYIFDGVTPPPRVGKGAKTWQFCDITDPLLSKLVNTTDISPTFDASNWGWYHNGTLCKLRVLMRDKMRCLLDGVDLPHNLYDMIATIPDTITADNISKTYFPNQLDSKLYKLSSEVRFMAKSAAGLKTKDPRFARRQMQREKWEAQGPPLIAAKPSPYFVDGSGDGDGEESSRPPDAEGTLNQEEAMRDQSELEERSEALGEGEVEVEVDPLLDEDAVS